MTRLWNTGILIAVVETQDAHPTAFTWQGERHRIEHVHKSWRVDTQWWRRRTWRAYFKVSTYSGLLVIVFQDLTTGQWYLQRLYD